MKDTPEDLIRILKRPTFDQMTEILRTSKVIVRESLEVGYFYNNNAQILLDEHGWSRKEYIEALIHNKRQDEK